MLPINSSSGSFPQFRKQIFEPESKLFLPLASFGQHVQRFVTPKSANGIFPAQRHISSCVVGLHLAEFLSAVD